MTQDLTAWKLGTSLDEVEPSNPSVFGVFLISLFLLLRMCAALFSYAGLVPWLRFGGGSIRGVDQASGVDRAHTVSTWVAVLLIGGAPGGSPPVYFPSSLHGKNSPVLLR